MSRWQWPSAPPLTGSVVQFRPWLAPKLSLDGGVVNGRVARLLAIGLVTGLAGGLLGVGGGFVMVPAMVYLMKTPQREANGTSLAVIVPVAIVGAAVLGARLTRRVSDIGLRRAFGIVAVLAGMVMIADSVLRWVGGSVQFAGGLRPTGISLWLMALLVGAVAGLLSGLLGIGGGAVMVPAMTLLMGLSQHMAQGTSLLVIIPTAVSGSITHFRMGNIRLETAAWLSAGGVVGAVGGAYLALASPDAILRLLFGGYLAFTGVRMLQAPKTKVVQPTMAS